MLLQPIEKVIDDKKFILSKFPAVEGLEIVSGYLTAGYPNILDYKLVEPFMFKLLAYVAIPIEGTSSIKLTTKELVNNHIKNWKQLIKVQHEMIELNSDFSN